MDNAADPEIDKMVDKLNRSAKIPIRYLAEPECGLHYARHAGGRAATGEILVFTDDDATFSPDWLSAYARAFADYPEMAAAGGPVRPVWAAPPPRWLLDFMGTNSGFGILSLMEPYQEFHLDRGISFFGVNMAIRSRVLFEMGGFHPESIGDLWIGDGESGLNRKISNHGLLIGYVPQALVYHHIPPERMTVPYFCRRMANQGASAEYSHFSGRVPESSELLIRLGRIGLSMIKLGWLSAKQMAEGADKSASLRFRLGLALHLSRLRYVILLAKDLKFRRLLAKTDWLNS